MRVLRLAGAAVVAAACGGGNGGTPPPPAVSSVTITPNAAQSINVGGTVGFSAQPRDGQNNVLSNRTINWTSTDPTKVSLSGSTGSSVTATGLAAGSSQVYAASEGRESSRITVTVTPAAPPPQQATVEATASSTFNPSSVTIAAGGTVTWNFAPTPPHNVMFTSSNVPPGGDIGTTQNTSVPRTFPNPGSYPYTCNLHPGMNGTVIVVQP